MISLEYLNKLPLYEVIYEWQYRPEEWKECRLNGIRAVNLDAAISGFRFSLLAYMAVSGVPDPEHYYEKDVRVKKIILSKEDKK